MIAISVDGRPAPKGSRIWGRTKTGKSYTRPASKYEKPWVEEVRRATQVAMRHHEIVQKPYSVTLDFRLKKPRNNRYWWPTTHDLDKLARAVIDGLVAGGAMEDDRHVCALTVTKNYAVSDAPEGVDATISGVPSEVPG